MYLFGIVAVLLILDVIFMLPTTIVSSSILRRTEREISSENVSNELLNYIALLNYIFILGWTIA